MSYEDENTVEGEVIYDLPYRLIPEPGQESEVSYAPRAFEKYLKMLTPVTLAVIVGAWSIIFLYFDAKFNPEDRIGAVSIILYNLVSYVIIRFAMSIKKIVMIAMGIVGVIFMLSLNTGLNTLLMLLLLAAAVAKSYYVRKGLPKYSQSQARGTADLASVEECQQPVWGTPGGNIDEASKFGEKADVGAKGEKIVGEALEKIAREYPFVRVFHGVKFVPGSRETWDIDHVVIIGSNVYFIDAKYWAFGSYEWVNGEVWRDGGPFNGGKVKMDAAIDRWAPRTRGLANVVARIALAKKETDTYFYVIDNSNSNGRVEVCSVKILMHELRMVARQTEPIVDRRLVRIFQRELL